MSDGIRILVVDDHPVVREGLAAMLESSAGMTVVGLAAGGEEGIKLFAEQRPDVVLVDLRMPVVDGIETLKRLRKLDAGVRVLILSSFDFAEDVYRAVEAGAQGYLLKDAPREELERAVRSAHAGRRVFPAEVAARLAERMTTSELTAREHEVLRAVARGESNRHIADALGITEGTVKGHVNNLLSKLGVRSRSQAIAAALRLGLVPPDQDPR